MDHTRSEFAVAFTQHALLVAWGQFAQALGLIQDLAAVPLHQKAYTHQPQTKVLEFLVAILGGLAHLKDISRAAHPLDQDHAVAQAWGQSAWADYSGVSRTLHALTAEEVQAFIQVLERVSRSFIDREVTLALRASGYLVYDGDLTGRPVSNTSTTYPNVRYGHMSDGLHLGYQAALLSLHSPTYGRLWLSVTSHPGNTVSCTQAEALVLAAEDRTGTRPWRRTDLLRQRVQALQAQAPALEAHLERSQQALDREQERLRDTQAQIQYWQQTVSEYETRYAQQQRPERPHSRLAQARQRLAVQQRRLPRRERDVARAQRRLDRYQSKQAVCWAQQRRLTQRLARFEHDNATNQAPIRAIFRLDAGFGTSENVGLLIEMGYEVYTKPYSHQVTTGLRQRITTETIWTPVGANAELVAWAAIPIGNYPYPLDVALERFYTGQQVRYSTLLHYGTDPVTHDLPSWFQTYNARQIIEAGIKEGKHVFCMYFIKVRAAMAILLQEHFTTFAANFVRWAAHWLTEQCPQLPTTAQAGVTTRVKDMVQVTAHTSAWIVWQSDGCLLQFTDHSIFAGRSLQVKKAWSIQPPLPLFKSCDFSRFG